MELEKEKKSLSNKNDVANRNLDHWKLFIANIIQSNAEESTIKGVPCSLVFLHTQETQKEYSLASDLYG